MERRDGYQNPGWPWSNPQDSSMPENRLRAAEAVNHQNWAPEMVNSGNNTNLTPYPGYYYNDFPFNFDQLSLSDPPPSPYVTEAEALPYSCHVRVNGGGSVLRNNPSFGLNGTPRSHLQYPNGNLRSMRFNSVQRGLFYDDNWDQSPVIGNSNGTYYDQDSGYNHYGYGSDRSFGNYGTEEDYLAMPQPRSNRNGLSLGRNGYRFSNGTNFGYRAEPINGFQDISQFNHVSLTSTGSQNGYNSGIYRTSQLMNFSSLEELRGKLALVAKDQQGGRFLQKKMEEGKSEDINLIYYEVKDNIHELMVDQFANYMVQKFFDVCSEEQITQLLLLVIKDVQILMDICVDMHGTRVMQKLIENVTTPEQRSLLLSALRRITVALMKNVNGHHVVQSCFKCFPPEDNKQILNVVADNCLEIAIDQSGCCILQQCVIHAEGEPRERLVAEITANALILSQHPYGNYVVQHIVGLKIPHVTAEIMARLARNFVFLSINKHGSNVVEHILKECPEHVNTIINEIIHSQNLLTVLQDPYGNYVAQTAVAKSKGAVHHKLMSLIEKNSAFLHSHLYGKRVLAKTRTKGSRSFHM